MFNFLQAGNYCFGQIFNIPLAPYFLKMPESDGNLMLKKYCMCSA